MDGWIPMCMTEGRCSPSKYHLTNTDSVLTPGKPRSIIYYFNLWNVIYVFICLCIKFLGVGWNPSCMIPRFLWSEYYYVYVVILAMLKLGFGRSRVMPCYSRDIGCLYDLIMEYWNMEERKKNWRPDGNCLAPSVSVKDRTVVGPADHVWFVLTAYRE